MPRSLRTLRDYVLRPWRLGEEPVVIQALHMAVYMILALVGLTVFADMPDALSGLGRTITLWTGWLLLAGGTLGALALPKGVWWLERAGLIFSLGGIGAYLASLFHYAGSDLGEIVIRGGLSLAGMLLLSVRLVRISGLYLDPTKRRKDGV